MFKLNDIVHLKQQTDNTYKNGKVIGFTDNFVSVNFKTETHLENLWVKPEEIMLVEAQTMQDIDMDKFRDTYGYSVGDRVAPTGQFSQCGTVKRISKRGRGYTVSLHCGISYPAAGIHLYHPPSGWFGK